MASEQGEVSVRVDGGVAVVTLDRPAKLNALSRHMEARLLEALTGDAVAASRCVVLTGAGRAFSAGADLDDYAGLDAGALYDNFEAQGRVYECFAGLPQPTIAAVTGYCIGGGLEMALGADLRIADDTAIFDLPEVAYGVFTSGAAYRLTRLVGTSKAKELLLFHRRLLAVEAERFGLVAEVVAPGDLLPRATELARIAAAMPPSAVRRAKALIDRVADAPREVAVALEQATYVALSQTEAARRSGGSGKRIGGFEPTEPDRRS